MNWPKAVRNDTRSGKVNLSFDGNGKVAVASVAELVNSKSFQQQLQIVKQIAKRQADSKK